MNENGDYNFSFYVTILFLTILVLTLVIFDLLTLNLYQTTMAQQQQPTILNDPNLQAKISVEVDILLNLSFFY
jgi:hypothetical protein